MSAHARRAPLGAAEAVKLKVNLLRVAVLAAALGLGMEAVLVIGGAATASISTLFSAGFWAFLICIAVAIGQSVAGGAPLYAGAFAAIASPAAFIAAKIIQKGMSVLLNGAASGSFVEGSDWLEAGLRALEYAVLIGVISWLARQQWAGALAHVGIGLLIGLVFGTVIAIFLPPDSWLSFVVEELVFPAGCALIIFVSETLVQLLPVPDGDPAPAESS